MINVKDMPINKDDIEEIRWWTKGYRENREIPLTWTQLAKETDVGESTLSAFVAGTYNGVNENVARKLFKFRQSIEAQTKRQQQLPQDPGYFDTETSKRMMDLLEYAHIGKITVCAAGPGTGKTMTLLEYQERAQPVWVATMKPSTTRLNPAIQEVHKALGLEPRHMTAAQASGIVIEKVRDRNGLLVIDEANFLSIEAIEEIRSWNDAVGLGICFMGNEELLDRIETGRQSDQLARLNRRIGRRHVQRLPTKNDVMAFCDAWGITQHDIRGFLDRFARTPDSGGLGECQQLIEAGTLLAAADDRGLTLGDVRDAQSLRSTRWIK